MLDALRSFIAGDAPATPSSAVDGDVPAEHLAAAALLVEAAMADGTFDDSERAQVDEVLAHLFDLPPDLQKTLVSDAEAAVKDSLELYSFSRAVKDAFEYDRRVELMQMIWEVVYADGQLDDFEANLVRRISGLLYVTDQDSGRARKRALDQLGLDPNSTS